MPQARKPIKLQVAAPCNEDWNKMFGDEAVRFCGTCRQNVYNLSAMTDPEVRKLLDGPRPCVRFFQRDDGTVVTRKCSRMLDAARRRLVAVGLGLAPAAFAFWGGVAWLRQILHGSPTMGEPPPREVRGEPVPPVMPPPPEPLMGVPPPPEPPVKRRPRRLMGKPPMLGKDGPR
jgi:hypothetical protein